MATDANPNALTPTPTPLHHQVKFATHTTLGMPVAIKAMQRKRIEKQNMSAKVHREINFLRKCNHPNVIRLY